METIDNFTNWVTEYALNYGLKIVGALITLIIGLWVINLISRSFSRLMEKREWDLSLRGFLKSLIGILLKIMLIITVISMMGIQMTSFVAILAAAGLAVGMALSGTLQNFAGGVMILIFKPFKVGDYIQAQGYSGTVSEIQIFNTILKTPDNQTIIIPNGGLSTGSMVNFSVEENRRVDFSFGIAYGDDFDQAKIVIQKLIDADERILKDPVSFIALGALGDSSVNITVRVWVKAANYWPVHFDMQEKVYKEFPKEGLNIPFPQLDVHIQN